MLLILHPPVLAQPASPQKKPVPLEDALQDVLGAFEEGLPLPEPKVLPQHRPALAWLRIAAAEDRPANPFSAGSAAHKEAKAVLAFLKADPPGNAAALDRLPISQAGSQLLLWRWGKALGKRGALPDPLRMAWEDRLLRKGLHPSIRGFALRHALCFALAQADEARFVDLKGRLGAESMDMFSGFQRLFAMLGGPSPTFRLWSLPGLQTKEARLDQLDHRRVWIHPAVPGTGPWGPGLAWVVPAERGETGAEDTHPRGEDEREAARLDRHFQERGWQAWYAPTRGEWSGAGLDFFPILVELDAQGQVTAIRMGDAAPARP